MDDLIGREIGPFRVLRSLGAEPPSTLFEARDASDAPVALRVLPRSPGGSPGEGALAGLDRLAHPHILGVLASGHVNGFTYIATPMAEGPSLADRRASGPLERRDLVEIARALGDALDHAHAEGVVHGGLSPASVRMDDGGRPRIVDFGVGGQIDPAARLAWISELDGALLYQAPEVALGHRPTRASDVYSLGAMLFELATGRPPYRADTPVLLGMKHAGEPVPSARALRPDLGEAADRVLAQSLAKHPQQRFASAGALAAALAAALDEPGRAPREARPALAALREPEQPSPSRGRVRRWAPAVALALFIWSTLPLMPTLRRLVLESIGEWMITVFASVFFALIGVEAVRRLVWKLRVRQELPYWRLFGIVVAYGLALTIYGSEPVEQMHLIYYGALGVLIFRALVPPMPAFKAHVLAIVMVWGLGWIDEWIQYGLNVYHVPITEWLAGLFDTTREVAATYFHKRYYDLRDVRLNATAGLLGQLALAWWRSLPRGG